MKMESQYVITGRDTNAAHYVKEKKEKKNFFFTNKYQDMQAAST